MAKKAARETATDDDDALLRIEVQSFKLHVSADPDKWTKFVAGAVDSIRTGVVQGLSEVKALQQG